MYLAKSLKPGLGKVLKYVKIQAQDSIDQIPEFFPPYVNSPEAFFNLCKSVTTYKKDPKNIEYIQEVRTLLGKNQGRGDCDCFTVLGLAGLTYYGLADNLYICLVGKTRMQPSHIYLSLDWKGKHHIFDLTNQYFDFERCKNYRYKQTIPITL
jgi:hypothetical protein